MDSGVRDLVGGSDLGPVRWQRGGACGGLECVPCSEGTLHSQKRGRRAGGGMWECEGGSHDVTAFNVAIVISNQWSMLGCPHKGLLAHAVVTGAESTAGCQRPVLAGSEGGRLLLKLLLLSMGTSLWGVRTTSVTPSRPGLGDVPGSADE